MSKKLLLADDSITIQKVIQITFAHEDYELTITDNGDAALAKAQEVNPDLIMADVYMPGKNGYELTTAIRQDAALQNVPVLLLAGSFEPFDEDKAKSCQANAWIEKPFESQNLIDKVAELLSTAPAAMEAPAAPAPTPEPAAETPVPAPDIVEEESPVESFEEPVPAEQQVAAPSEDPFGDISFEEEAPAATPEPEAVTDDWSDVAAEPQTAEEPVFTEEAAVEASDDFSFADEAGPEEFATADEAPAASVEPEPFEMGDDDIMPLDEDDILGAEDL
ncbi:MAG: response regulator, partial [Gammaproteobacteria bacterium]|nr:response regulator [Gammaproteobacteria bacterium]NIR94869.1 response regulator [Gammaproteobacteria bacterium]